MSKHVSILIFFSSLMLMMCSSDEKKKENDQCMARENEKEETHKIFETIAFHNRTKHHFHRMSPRKGNPRWEDQPNAFRTYRGVPLVPLPLESHTKNDQLMKKTAKNLFVMERQKSEILLTLESISSFLRLSLGLATWKQAGNGNRWTLRVNPSSGALHPTEAYLFFGKKIFSNDGSFINNGLYHYHSFEHALEYRASVTKTIDTIEYDNGCEGFLLALSSVIVRESFKYGERAFRYCNHDVGHAIAALGIAASLHGWHIQWLNTISSERMQKLLCFTETDWYHLEDEEPDILLFISTKKCLASDADLPAQLLKILEESVEAVFGTPRRLARKNIRYEEIEKIRAITSHSGRICSGQTYISETGETIASRFSPVPISKDTAIDLIFRRRSVWEMNGRSHGIPRASFLGMLEALLPRESSPFLHRHLVPNPAIHLLIFVHRVVGMSRGLYIFVRNEDDLPDLQRSIGDNFLWSRVLINENNAKETIVSDAFPLYLLRKGDYTKEAETVSCNQQIAGSSAFSLGMLARFDSWMEASRYKELFWESGMVGQGLYLLAEAHGMRGTGIGCFYDDAVHEEANMRRYDMFQSIYHFTVGHAVEDRRVQNTQPYAHLKGSRDVRPYYPIGGGIRGQ